ncbi:MULTISPECIES: penicillin acylase family protein [Bradyrhizobium]|uniref:penicillin acylase family protein n=1 Tax=Bradyrhizobium TaxID=374 RepID=UPI00040F652F|nr:MULTISPECIES: penicillin acylase family protein [Bradyrhizobium]MBR1001969.1 penicillin acylase family protein [Bradyrhizobium liaoningense]MCP1749197.1 penicillin amidase [Bradyrhizobium japonicum]MCP1855151.1 penicillin amidase [Bradyrhizobium japonicum]MCP1897808.1 penicillin amidase [Bradyrhizobium japonicum]MCW2330967.1 penicillin amidase [Bradyrhizobium japonicum]
MMVNLAGLLARPIRFPLALILAGPILVSFPACFALDPEYGLAVFLTAVAVSIIGAWLFLRLSLPVVTGRLRLRGLNYAVRIARDLQGVPHISASSSEDAYRALGFVHAQDRLWQMEYQRRVAGGEVAEIIGSRGVALDRFMRTVGLRHAASMAWQGLSHELRNLLDAYADGINQAIESMGTWRLPPEFQLLAFSPVPFSAIDVVLTGKLLAWDLAGSYVTQLLWQDLSENLGEERANQLLPPLEKRAAMSRARPRGLRHACAGALRLHGENVGSSSWVVGGEGSVHGMPVLANDPHLPATMPINWYVAHLRAGELDVAGATIPGIPFVLIGRNRDIVWGMVNLNADTQQLFLETLDSEGRAARHGDHWEPLQCRQETIRIRGKPNLSMTARSSRHGPMLSDVFNTIQDGGLARAPISLAWTALHAPDGSLATFAKLAVATNLEDFRAAVALLVAPAMHFTYADRSGKIARVVAGRIPANMCLGSRGLRDATDPGQAWHGWYAAEQLPRDERSDAAFVVVNTPSGLGDDSPDLGQQWVAPYRRQRIEERLASKPRMTAIDHTSVQSDVLSSHARAVLPGLVDRVRPIASSERVLAALESLAAWDYDAGASSAPAALFAAWWRRLPHNLLSAEIDGKLLATYLPWSSFVDRFVQEEIVRIGPEKAGPLLLHSLEQAVIELDRRFGSERRKWGRLHRAVFAHQPFHHSILLRRLFSRSVPSAGDWSSVNISPSQPGTPYLQTLVAGYRQIVDLSDIDAGRFQLATGQSGHFLSSQYSDQIDEWLAGRSRPLHMSKQAWQSDTRAVLSLDAYQGAPR